MCVLVVLDWRLAIGAAVYLFAAGALVALSAVAGRRDGVQQRPVARELAGLDRVLDARVILVHDAAGADIEMADLGVPHLAVGQPDVLPK